MLCCYTCSTVQWNLPSTDSCYVAILALLFSGIYRAQTLAMLLYLLYCSVESTEHRLLLCRYTCSTVQWNLPSTDSCYVAILALLFSGIYRAQTLAMSLYLLYCSVESTEHRLLLCCYTCSTVQWNLPSTDSCYVAILALLFSGIYRAQTLAMSLYLLYCSVESTEHRLLLCRYTCSTVQWNLPSTDSCYVAILALLFSGIYRAQTLAMLLYLLYCSVESTEHRLLLCCYTCSTVQWNLPSTDSCYVAILAILFSGIYRAQTLAMLLYLLYCSVESTEHRLLLCCYTCSTVQWNLPSTDSCYVAILAILFSGIYRAQTLAMSLYLLYCSVESTEHRLLLCCYTCSTVQWNLPSTDSCYVAILALLFSGIYRAQTLAMLLYLLYCSVESTEHRLLLCCYTCSTVQWNLPSTDSCYVAILALLFSGIYRAQTLAMLLYLLYCSVWRDSSAEIRLQLCPGRERESKKEKRREGERHTSQGERTICKFHYHVPERDRER